MAAAKKGQTSKLILKVQTGLNKAGEVTLSQRTFNNVNPALADVDLLAIGTALGALQSHTVDSVNRQDEAQIGQA
ncbi:DUF1659 domain-containing protein [Propionispira raffinosivorans]|uniref:DUF1659 domain-containing protein n=1 Tax=Propionispira raffinosivorans TaxID=86959 RepID=UPI000375324C|nr:DUF1659 domain-containing protein [Propionispira raffinosivorans]